MENRENHIIKEYEDGIAEKIISMANLSEGLITEAVFSRIDAREFDYALNIARQLDEIYARDFAGSVINRRQGNLGAAIVLGYFARKHSKDCRDGISEDISEYIQFLEDNERVREEVSAA